MGFGFPSPTLVGSDCLFWWISPRLHFLDTVLRCDFSQEFLVLCSYVSCWLLFLNFCTSGWPILEFEAKSCYSAIYLVPSSHKPELHHLMVMAAKAVPDLQIQKTVKLLKAWKALTHPPVEDKDVNADTNGLYTRKGLMCFAIIVKSCFHFFISLEMLSLWDTLSRYNLQEDYKLSVLQTSVLAA